VARLVSFLLLSALLTSAAPLRAQSLLDRPPSLSGEWIAPRGTVQFNLVPGGCIVVIEFVNLDGTPGSAELILDKDPMPNMGGDPAISGGYTRDLTQGLPQGEKDVLRLTAPPSGSLRIFCGVPGHGLSGMWIRFKVDPASKAPSWKTS
jgi:hypothetical protein